KPGLFTSGSGTPLMIGEAGILPDGFMPQTAQPHKKFAAGDLQQPKKKKSGEDEALHNAIIPKSPDVEEAEEVFKGFNPEENDKTGIGSGEGPGIKSNEQAEAIKKKIAEAIQGLISSNPELSKL